jgi:hypothetical protein
MSMQHARGAACVPVCGRSCDSLPRYEVRHDGLSVVEVGLQQRTCNNENKK